MKIFKTSTYIVIFLSILLLILISYFTYNILIIEDNPSIYIDFSNKHDEISSYSSLIGGLLSFLSILFVIYTILFQKDINEKHLELNEQNKKEDLKNKIEILIIYLDTYLETLDVMNKNIQEYLEIERKFPTQMHILYFNVNKNFDRFIKISPDDIYCALKEFKKEEEWKNLFVDLYSLIDYYHDLLLELKNNNINYKNDKYKDFNNINTSILNLYDIKAELIAEIRDNFPRIYNEKPWTKILNKSIIEYYSYLENTSKKQIQNDLDEVNEKILTPFLEEAVNLDRILINKYQTGRKIINITSRIRKELYSTKSKNFYYLNNLETYNSKYFSKESNSIQKIIKIKKELEDYINTISVNVVKSQNRK